MKLEVKLLLVRAPYYSYPYRRIHAEIEVTTSTRCYTLRKEIHEDLFHNHFDVVWDAITHEVKQALMNKDEL